MADTTELRAEVAQGIKEEAVWDVFDITNLKPIDPFRRHIAQAGADEHPAPVAPHREVMVVPVRQPLEDVALDPPAILGVFEAFEESFSGQNGFRLALVINDSVDTHERIFRYKQM